MQTNAEFLSMLVTLLKYGFYGVGVFLVLWAVLAAGATVFAWSDDIETWKAARRSVAKAKSSPAP